MSDWNAGIIDEFRANDGRVGGMFEGAPLLLLHHVGARTGTERVSPLMYQATNGSYAIFASKAGADTNPDWFHNLVANPETWVEIGENNIIREGVTIHRSMSPEAPTRIGSDCFLMAYAHIAHDCVVGDGVIIANESFQGMAAARVIIEAAGGKFSKIDGSEFHLNDYLDGQRINDHLLVAAPENFNQVRNCLKPIS